MAGFSPAAAAISAAAARRATGEDGNADESSWLRILKHRLLDESDVRRALGPTRSNGCRRRVRRASAATAARSALCIEAGLPLSYLWRNATPRERAVAMFGKLRVWDTEQNNGVLIYLLLAEHAIEIVADRGLAQARARTSHWQALVAQHGRGLQGRALRGRARTQAIDAVHDLLVAALPAGEGAGQPQRAARRAGHRVSSA